MVQGLRPAKPENASSIGFSNSLWSFVQRCWDGDLKLRPKVAEVVMHLGREAADWNGLMPPYSPVENAVFDLEGPPLDALEHREFTVLIFPRCCSLSNYTVGIVPWSNSPPQSVEGEGITSVSRVKGDPTAHRELQTLPSLGITR